MGNEQGTLNGDIQYPEGIGDNFDGRAVIGANPMGTMPLSVP